MSRRIRLICGTFAAVVAVTVGTVPAMASEGGAAGGQGCGVGTRVSFFSSTAGQSGNGAQNGAFSRDSAQNSDPNFGQEISGPTGATNCSQGQL